MKKIFIPLLVVTVAMFAYAPIMIANAPYQSTMLLIQKVFYFHVPSWIALTCALVVCGISSAIYLFKGSPTADRFAVAGAEIVVVFGLCGLVTGSLWARKAWGIWWEWDARLTMAFMLELVFVSYILVRKYAGPGSDKLAAAMGIFGAATAPFIYKSVDWWRTIHPKTSVIPTLEAGMFIPFAYCSVAFVCLFGLLLTARVWLEEQRARLDDMYLAEED